MATASGYRVKTADVLRALETLLTPVKRDQDPQAGASTREVIISSLQRSLEAFHKHLDEGDGHLKAALALEQKLFTDQNITASTEWAFVSTILQLLHILKTLLSQSDKDSMQQASPEDIVQKLQETNLKPKRPQDAPPLSDKALSVTQISVIRSALQFVTRLGICPKLNPGVGIPLQHRTKMMTSSSEDFINTANGNIAESSKSKRQKLSLCITVLSSLLDVEELSFIILNSHLIDLLAGLLQLLNAKPVSAADTKKHQTSQTPMNVDSGEEVLKDSCSKDSDRTLQTGNEKNNAGYLTATATAENSSSSREVICAQPHCENNPEAVDIDVAVEDTSTKLPTDNKHYQKCLSKILSSASPGLVIRELMVLQAGVPQSVQNARKSSGGGQQVTVQPPPVWLRKACSQILQQITTGPKGIVHLYSAMAVGVDPSSPAHWKCCQAVAKVVSRSPVPVPQVSQHVEKISHQLFEMLHTKEKSTAGQLSRLVGAVVSEMSAAHRECFHHSFFEPLMQPLAICLDTSESHLDGKVVVEEETLSRCLDDLHKVFVVGQQPQASILSALQPVVSVLWALFVITRSGVYNIKGSIREILVTYLKFQGKTNAATLLRQLTIGASILETENAPHLTARFVSGSSGGLKAVHAGDKMTAVGEKDQVEAVIDILGDLKTDGVTGELLVVLLKELTEMISMETQSSDIILPVRVERSEVREQKAEDLKRKVTLLHLLATICETFGSECLADTGQILSFVKVSLEHGVMVCRKTSEEEMALFETETMSMALGLLTTVLAGAVQMTDEHRAMLDEMLPLLAVIGEEHPDEFIKEMAADIRVAIATRGAVWSSLQEKRSQGKKRTEPLKEEGKIKIPGSKQSSGRPLIEELPDSTTSTSPASSEHLQHPSPSLSAQKGTGFSVKSSEDTSPVQMSESQNKKELWSSPSVSKTSDISNMDVDRILDVPSVSSSDELGISQDSSEKSSLHKVFEQLCDPLLPVRGHALMALTSLVQDKDPETLNKKDTVLKVFQENMQHGDSYLYLAAINGMSALADRFPERVVPALAREFADFSREKKGADGRSERPVTSDHRLKLGEALMKATRCLGETIPKYRDILLAAVLSGARDCDAAVRASSVSNLAELCQLLRFSLGPVLQEVLSCCSGLLTGEDVIVRRAAALTLAKILDGLDTDAFTVLDSNMRDLYRLLKNVHERDPDDAVRLHTNMALVQLDSVTRGFLFPKQTLQKKIQVLPDADTFR